MLPEVLGELEKQFVMNLKREVIRFATIDLLENNYFIGDLADEKVLIEFAEKVISEFGKIDCLINNAFINKGGLNSSTYDDFNYALKVGITAPFMLTKLFQNYFNTNASIVNISSIRQFMSQPNTESYSAAKGGISALTHAMAVTLAGKVRVNSISPGWIDITESTFDTADNTQHLVGRVGKPADIVNAVLFLCDPQNGFITGQGYRD